MANTYEESTDLLRGEELLLYVKSGEKYIPIAFASSHTLSLSADTIDTTNKFSGQWKTVIAGQIGWQVSAESLVSRTTGHMSYQTLAKLMAKRQPIEVVMAEPKATPGELDDEFAMDETKKWNAGTAYITSLDKKADKGAICSSSITLQGTGALKDSTGVALDEAV
ncbi:phage tail tube protein [Bacteroides sedimenti]|uniref:Phage major tail protein, TP901-1 family n=1 Tax=Bacteroides sedimenti TaxID=2136147 RepID=A0ABN6Z0H6_9BACE